MRSSDLTRREFLEASGAAAWLTLAGGLTGCSGSSVPAAPARGPNSLPDPRRPAGSADPALPFDHVVVVMMENHSFDNYLGMLARRGQPRADGFTFDANGAPLDRNPVDGGFQHAFHLQGTCQPGSVTQSWNSTHRQIDGGRMDGFAVTSTTAMGYWDETDLPFYYSLAKTFCVGNRSFASAPCQTYPNRRFLYAATAQGLIATDAQTFSLPPPANGTLMDRMSQYGVSWRSYFTDLPALAIIPQTLEKHPLNFATLAQFYLDCALGTLPAVSFVDPEFNIVSTVGAPLFDFLKPVVGKIPGLPAEVVSTIQSLQTKIDAQGGSEENPDDIAIGEAFVASVVQAVMNSPAWPRTLLVWTYDEHGGYYDHVPPVPMVKPDDIAPMLAPGDAPGGYDLSGLRVPTVVVSPYSRPHAVTDVVHDHTSIIATIAAKWNLPALTYRDAQANTLLDFLDLASPPAFLRPPTLAAPAAPTLGLSGCPGTPPPPVITPG
ncbi:MAG: alkaline phosphatase family protein [Sinobacteraceae bacterium]|nr:alkaline phosphatase family protein [Nevskiaceae bacterium]